MTKIVQTYFYPEGTTLDTGAHNDAIMGESGSGLMGTINGHIDTENFNTKFRIKPEHVMSEQAAIGRQEWDQYSTTIYSDGVSSGNISVQNEDQNRFRIPGCTLRFYQPYQASFALLQWSLFVGVTKWKVTRAKNLDDLFPRLNFVAYLDGNKLDHTYRKLGRSHQLDSSTTSSIGGVKRINNESHNALWYDMSHLVTGLSSGWHELSVHLVLANVLDENGDTQLEELLLNVGEARREYDYYLFQKATFGVRNARVLTML